MGYRSDIVIVHSFMHKSHAKEILTAFTLDKRCQKYDLTQYLKISCDETQTADGVRGVYSLVFVGEQWRWYEDTMLGAYEDVKCINSMLDLCKDFHKERGIPYAYKFLRIGEETNDVETREDSSQCKHGEFLEDYQESSAYIHTTIEQDFRNLKSVSEGLTELQGDKVEGLSEPRNIDYKEWISWKKQELLNKENNNE